jgi:hypothetical protein
VLTESDFEKILEIVGKTILAKALSLDDVVERFARKIPGAVHETLDALARHDQADRDAAKKERAERSLKALWQGYFDDALEKTNKGAWNVQSAADYADAVIAKLRISPNGERDKAKIADLSAQVKDLGDQLVARDTAIAEGQGAFGAALGQRDALQSDMARILRLLRAGGTCQARTVAEKAVGALEGN